jgi:hypothetical protein
MNSCATKHNDMHSQGKEKGKGRLQFGLQASLGLVSVDRRPLLSQGEVYPVTISLGLVFK